MSGEDSSRTSWQKTLSGLRLSHKAANDYRHDAHECWGVWFYSCLSLPSNPLIVYSTNRRLDMSSPPHSENNITICNSVFLISHYLNRRAHSCVFRWFYYSKVLLASLTTRKLSWQQTYKLHQKEMKLIYVKMEMDPWTEITDCLCRVWHRCAREEMLWRTVENYPKYCNAVIF